MMTPNLETLTLALPESFAFYHLGQIATDQARERRADELRKSLELDDRRSALAYTLRGDLQASVVLLLEPGLDLSMYSEAGNIIASKLVTRLADEHGIDVLLSPPTRIDKSQLDYLVKAAGEIAQKTYIHSHAGQAITLDALIFVFKSGNASGAEIQA